jgi:porphobilinogen synthase
MPGVYQRSIDVALDWLSGLAKRGISAFIAFGVIDRALKNAGGDEALNPDNVVCRLLREVKARQLPMTAISDLCFCEYTDHGHCGILTSDKSTVDNDATLPRLAQQAVNHARAGADVVAPSGMMDNGVAAIRNALDSNGLGDISILAYSVKYASSFYCPFRDAADSVPSFGDRKTYQMDPARGADEAMAEIQLDIQQGADIVMVKPAGAYLDVIAAARNQFKVPIAAYQVSGEYAMLHAAAQKGWLDLDSAMRESLLAIKRAGADMIITYFAERMV